MDNKEDKDSGLIDNTELNRFELITNGLVSRIEYTIIGKKIFLNHTEVPHELEGKGIGSKIIKLALEEIGTRGLKVVPICPFAASYIERHPEWKKLLPEDVKIK